MHHILLASQHSGLHCVQRYPTAFMFSIEPSSRRLFGIIHEMENEFETVGGNIYGQDCTSGVVGRHVAQKSPQGEALGK
jgi:hypothetical protein